MDLSIIIINKDTPKLTNDAINSAIYTIKNIEFEIIVVDNSTEKKNIIVSNNEKVFVKTIAQNKGFGNACNIGAKIAKGEVLLFLNSDTILFKNTVNEVFSFFKQKKKVGAVGVRQLLENGRLDAGCKRAFPKPLNSLYYFLGLSKIFPNSKRFGAYQQTFIDEEDIAYVDCISGAFMLIKKKVFAKIGGFDEDYFLYGEDVDLCFRLKKAGFNNIYYGKVSFLHYKNKSGKNSLKVVESFYESMKIFYDKHYKEKYCFIVEKLVKLGINFKFFLAKRKFYRENKR